jgi:hypothetical protein
MIELFFAAGTISQNAALQTWHRPTEDEDDDEDENDKLGASTKFDLRTGKKWLTNL